MHFCMFVYKFTNLIWPDVNLLVYHLASNCEMCLSWFLLTISPVFNIYVTAYTNLSLMVSKKLKCFIVSQLISAHIRIFSNTFLPLCEHVTDCWSHRYIECKAGVWVLAQLQGLCTCSLVIWTVICWIMMKWWRRPSVEVWCIWTHFLQLITQTL